MINRTIQSGVVCSALGTEGIGLVTRRDPEFALGGANDLAANGTLRPAYSQFGPPEEAKGDPRRDEDPPSGEGLGSIGYFRSASNCSSSVLGSRPRFG